VKTLHTTGLVLFGLIAFFWLTHGLRVAFGALRLPWIKDFAPAADSECPKISLIFAARDEEEKLPSALTTLAALDYPQLEIVAVDDRSQDATGKILNEFAATRSRFHVVHVKELPPGWLGKPHALQIAYEASIGDWLLFTDADVQFKADTLRRAITLAKSQNLDHLTLFGDVEMRGFWEKVLITFFGLAFHLATHPSRASQAGSRYYVGVGAFQLVKRMAYETSGTHRRLAMEVIDDMKLGKIVKLAGFRSAACVGQDAVVVPWHAGMGNLVRGVEKNFFAAANYNAFAAAGQFLGLLLMNVLPFLGLLFGHGWIRILSAIVVVIALGFHVGVDKVMRVSPLYALTFPLGASIFSYMLLRSAVLTLTQGGIFWRGTFYPIEELRRGIV